MVSTVKYKSVTVIGGERQRVKRREAVLTGKTTLGSQGSDDRGDDYQIWARIKSKGPPSIKLERIYWAQRVPLDPV